MSLFNRLVSKVNELISDIKENAFNIRDSESFEPLGYDKFFENEYVWNVSSGKSNKHIYPRQSKTKESNKLELTIDSSNIDIAEVLNSRYLITDESIAVNKPWDIEEEIKSAIKKEMYRPVIDDSMDISSYADRQFGEDSEMFEYGKVGSKSFTEMFEQSRLDPEQVIDEDLSIAETYDYQTNPEKDLLNFKPHKLSLADESLVQDLQNKHTIFHNLLARIQETHAPNDFIAAYQIQDRIAYLLDNKTLLYSNLVKQLIVYVERINKKLQIYYNEIQVKTEDLKKMNSEISRFKQYSVKAQDKIENLITEKQILKNNITKMETSLQS